jgi:hypothetical protein
MCGTTMVGFGRLPMQGGSLSAATISVLLEPLLMAAAALVIALTGSQFGWLDMQGDTRSWGLQIFGLTGILLAVHPKVLNPCASVIETLKGKASDSEGFQTGTLSLHSVVRRTRFRWATRHRVRGYFFSPSYGES